MSERAETGATQFGDDWPGVFIRGDQAGWYALKLRHWIDDPEHVNPLLRMEVEGLASILGGCKVERGREPTLTNHFKPFRECVQPPAEREDVK